MRVLLSCLGATVLVLLAQPAIAGPPFVSDDPEPTPYHQFEIYTFNNGTNTRDGTGGEAGLDFNYGAAPDLQLTATLPAGFNQSVAGGTNFGLSNIEIAAKYRFLHQDTFGLDVAVFPRVFLSSGSNTIGDNHTSLLLPVWVERDWKGGWSTFGGRGCVFSAIRTADFCLAGAVLTYQLMPQLQIGAELFHRTADFQGNPASSSVGVGWRYDLNKNFHLLGYIRRGVENAEQTDRYSWYASVLFTFLKLVSIWRDRPGPFPAVRVNERLDCLVGCVKRGLPSANYGDARFKSLSMSP